MPLTLSEWKCPTADLGGENPHAALSLPFPAVAHYEDQDVPVSNCLPYQIQDRYGRERVTRSHRTAVLESGRLKATFLLELGGRLWSLIHKPTGRELLYVNPVIQFANFGIRNAWFSGGMEWNVGVFGHSVFTCSPVFAGRVASAALGDGLRIWEFERTRGVVWQVDIFTPEDSDHLLVSPRIVNPHAETIPMYWWTCIAVPETPGGRVLAPAQRAFEPAHAMGETSVFHDLAENPDVTYPQRRELPKDTYFEIPENVRPWIAHVEPTGEGVLHVSSSRLCGRKQWVWGMRQCGRRWQDWLSPGGPPYIEIQGGLAAKQSDYVPMPGRASWSWLEAYGPVSRIDAPDWTSAIHRVDEEIGRTLPTPAFEALEREIAACQNEAPLEVIHQGSGWGALEEEVRKSAGEAALAGPGTPFPRETLGAGQSMWLATLSVGNESKRVEESPGPYMADFGWHEALQLREDRTSNWQILLHLGVLRFANGAPEAAREAWRRSLEIEPNGWAARNLALFAEIGGELKMAAELIVQAQRSLPSDPTVLAEACRILLAADQQEMLGRLLGDLPTELQELPRVRLARARIALSRCEFESVRDYFRGACDLADIREAETTVSDLWRALCEQDPSCGDPEIPPREWDFRMR